ncbi:hypothetical protein F5884DRAFT_754265 [Xylogone sp. PMI_703]|nr:hypothetical protein F5884DRAFT_754265 [Xylogone sp. PMI_703]
MAPSDPRIITLLQKDPLSLSDKELLRLSLSTLSKNLNQLFSARTTFTIYFRWLEVHRQTPTHLAAHWPSAILQWTQSLRERGFLESEIIREVLLWKASIDPREDRNIRSPPSSTDISKAFHSYKEYNNRIPHAYKPEEWSEEAKRLEYLKTSSDFSEKSSESYRCNRCKKKGHFIQHCPTNLDPSYDSPPDRSYKCIICQRVGEHWRSLCPKNKDPYSLTQKRKALGISKSTFKEHRPGHGSKTSYSQPKDDRIYERHNRRHKRKRSADIHYDRSKRRFSSDKSDTDLENMPLDPESKPDIRDSRRKKSRLSDLFVDEMDFTQKEESRLERESSYSIESSPNVSGSCEENGHSANYDTCENDKHSFVESLEELISTASKDSELRLIEDESDSPTSDYQDRDVIDERQNSSDTLREAYDTDIYPEERAGSDSPFHTISEDGTKTKEYSDFVNMLIQSRELEMRELVNTRKRRVNALDMWEESKEKLILNIPIRTANPSSPEHHLNHNANPQGNTGNKNPISYHPDYAALEEGRGATFYMSEDECDSD